MYRHTTNQAINCPIITAPARILHRSVRISVRQSHLIIQADCTRFSFYHQLSALLCGVTVQFSAVFPIVFD